MAWIRTQFLTVASPARLSYPFSTKTISKTACDPSFFIDHSDCTQTGKHSRKQYNYSNSFVLNLWVKAKQNRLLSKASREKTIQLKNNILLFSMLTEVYMPSLVRIIFDECSQGVGISDIGLLILQSLQRNSGVING